MTHPANDDTRPASGPASGPAPRPAIDPITGPVVLPQSGDETASEDNGPESDDDEGS